MKNKYRSDLSLAKNLGSAGSGSKHWWSQRVTAIILMICNGWFIYFTWNLSGASLSNKIDLLQKPYNIVMLLLFTFTGLYHAVLGTQVVIEDYIKCRALKLLLLLFIRIFSIITAISFLVAVFYVMNL